MKSRRFERLVRIGYSLLRGLSDSPQPNEHIDIRYYLSSVLTASTHSTTVVAPVARPRRRHERPTRRRLRLRSGSIPADVRPALRPLLPLPELPAADGECFRHQRLD